MLKYALFSVVICNLKVMTDTVILMIGNARYRETFVKHCNTR